MSPKKVHLIAIGGSTMHNMAITLHLKGYQVTGSDDEIFDPSKSRLQQYNLLPEKAGWFPEKITTDLEAVIVGMHARKDNPEVLKAKELDIPIYSFPEYVYMQCQNKHRVVIGGSHGKTTITAMVMHVLQYHNKNFDYLIGAVVDGFDVMVKLTDDAPILIAEGDEYPASPLAPKPKFLYYKPHISLISGIAWDHVNIYETENDYVRQFDKLADATPKGGTLVYSDEDPLASIIGKKERKDVTSMPYTAHPHQIKDGKTSLITDDGEVPVLIFGAHNMKNLSAAKAILSRLGIRDKEFYEAIQSFKGAANRLELLGQNEQTTIYKDFAHAPSKLKATTDAMKKQYDRKLVACIELHTFSSLSKSFLQEYQHTFDSADLPIVYFNPKTVEHKKLDTITKEDIKKAFANDALQVFDDSDALRQGLLEQDWKNTNLLIMTSGNLDNLDIASIVDNILTS